MTEPTAEISEFFDHVRSLSIEGLSQIPEFIDLTANERLIKHPLLLPSRQYAWALEDKYPLIQCIFFDFARRCTSGCPVPYRHPHSVQAPGVLEVKRFPGVFIYPKIFRPVLPELPDAVMDLQEVEADQSRNDLHPDRLGANGRQVALPPELRSLVQGAFGRVLDSDSATVYVSKSDQSSGMRQPSREHVVTLHVSLGCDAILVMGNPRISRDYRRNEHIDETAGNNPKPPDPKPNLAAIQLRAGDAVFFGLQSPPIWSGIAKVLEQSSQLDQQWPHLRKDTRYSDQHAVRGQLVGRTIEVEFN